MPQRGDRLWIGGQQQWICPAVIMALELDDLLATGVTTRQADRRHAGLCSAVGETNLFGHRHHLNDEFRVLNFFGDGSGIMRAGCHGA